MADLFFLGSGNTAISDVKRLDMFLLSLTAIREL